MPAGLHRTPVVYASTMAKRLSIDDRVDALAKLRRGPSSPEAVQATTAGLADKSNLVVAKAAVVARELMTTSLVPNLVTAFDRFIHEPTEDKGCAALTAIVETLQTFAASESAVFLRGIHHVQMEGSYGGSVDAAVKLRCESAFGLVRMGYRDVMWELAALLADADRECRIAAARGIGHSMADAGLPLLKYKILSSGMDNEVTAECLASLIQINAEKSIPFLAPHLDSPDVALRDAAALALGGTRRPEAFDLLRQSYERRIDSEFRSVLLLAMAMQRTEPAIGFVVSVIAGGDSRTAVNAIKALALYRREEAIRARIAEAVKIRNDVMVGKTFEVEFR